MRYLLLALALLIFAPAATAQDDDLGCGPHPDMVAVFCPDIPYGEHERQTLDIYLPAMGETPDVMVVMVHGGGFVSGGKRTQNYVDLAELFVLHGYGVASVEYRLRDDAPFPAPVEDAFCGLGWLYAHGEAFGYRMERVVALGHSAGGLVAGLMGTVETPAEYAPDCVFSLPEDEIAVDAVVSFYAPSDISATGYERRTDLVPLDDADDAFFQRYSPLYQVDEDDDTPFLMVHGEDDEIVPLSESEALVAALDEAGIRAELVVIEDGGHDPQEWDDDVYFDVLFRLVLFVDRLGDVDADI